MESKQSVLERLSSNHAKDLVHPYLKTVGNLFKSNPYPALISRLIISARADSQWVSGLNMEKGHRSQGLVGIVKFIVTSIDDVPTASWTVVLPVVIFIKVVTRRDIIPLIQSLILVFAPRS